MGAVTTSVVVIDGPPADAERLDRELGDLRRRFPRATLDRYLDRLPRLGERVLLAPTAAVVGEVELGDDVSIWYGAILRGDLAKVVVGDRSNVQDGTVMHVGDDSPCVVGADTVVGHRVVLHACRVEDGCLIGMQATILDGAIIGSGSIVGAGALVTQRTVIPPRSLVLGSPGRVVRTLGEEEAASHRALAGKYVRLKENYLRDALRAGSV